MKIYNKYAAYKSKSDIMLKHAKKNNLLVINVPLAKTNLKMVTGEIK